MDGHILFSALDVTVGGKPVRALALAPLAQPLEAGPSFMALELQPGALRDGRGRVVYPPAFGV